MKHRLLILLTLVFAASSALTARADICSNATLKGAYAFTIHGQILAGPAVVILDGIALTTFDGNGNLTQVDAVADNGVVGQVWRPATGTYSLNSDRKSTRLNSSHLVISYAVFCLKK